MKSFQQQSETPELLRHVLCKNYVTVSDQIPGDIGRPCEYGDGINNTISGSSTRDVIGKHLCMHHKFRIDELANDITGANVSENRANDDVCPTGLHALDNSEEITSHPSTMQFRNATCSSLSSAHSEDSRTHSMSSSIGGSLVSNSHKLRYLSQLTSDSCDSGFEDSRRGSSAIYFPSCFESPLRTRDSADHRNRRESSCTADQQYDDNIPNVGSDDISETVSQFGNLDLNISNSLVARSAAPRNDLSGRHGISPLVSRDSIQQAVVHSSPPNSWLLSPLPTPPSRSRPVCSREQGSCDAIPGVVATGNCPTSKTGRVSIASSLFQHIQPRRERKASMNTQRLVKRTDIKLGDFVDTGSFGTVHEGTLCGRPVAIKVVHKRRGSGIHREILQAERLAQTLGLRHDNIVSVLSVVVSDGPRGDALVVMEMVSPGITLQAIIDDVTQSITPRQRTQYATEISMALQYLHKNEVAHLDVKPKNVLMTTEGVCKLADFGSLTRTGPDDPKEDTSFTQILGTLPYRAPELMRGSPPSDKADVFSLGITLWQLASRKTPHDGVPPHALIYQVVKHQARPPQADCHSVCDVTYRDVYLDSWQQDPALRPSSADVVNRLRDILADFEKEPLPRV